MGNTQFSSVAAAAVVIGLLAGTPARPQTGPVTVTGDKFSKSIEFSGPALKDSPLFGDTKVWRIRSWLTRETKAADHQLYVELLYSGSWRFYEAAADDSAQDLRVTKIASRVGSCSAGSCLLYETIGVNLPQETLAAKATSGFQVKLKARSGHSTVLDVTAAQIASQLEAIDRYRAGAAAAADGLAPLPPQSFGVTFGTARPMWGLPGGALVATVKGESVARRAGVKWADVIVEWNGETVSSQQDIEAKLVQVKAGGKVPFKILRARKIIPLEAQF